MICSDNTVEYFCPLTGDRRNEALKKFLAEHVADIHKVVADFRDAFERIRSSSSQSYGQQILFPLNHQYRRGSAFTTGTLDPDVERKTLLRNKLRWWHIVTLQEASDHVEHDILQERYHVTHCAGCAILFNKDTFYPVISVISIYLHDTRRGEQNHIVEGEQGWVVQGILSRASMSATIMSPFQIPPGRCL